MSTYENQILLDTRETSPVITTDGAGSSYARGTRFGEQVVAPLTPDFHTMEGRYFRASTILTTSATGTAGHPAPVVFEGIKPIVHIRNNNTAGGKRITLKRLTLRYTAIGAGGTLPRWWTCLEPSGTNRYTSGGTQLTPVNRRGGQSETSNALIYVGAVVAPVASANVRQLDGGQQRPVVPVIHDEITWRFGDEDSAGGGVVISGVLAVNLTINHGPVVLDPGDTFLLNLWRVSQSGADSVEAHIGYVER